MLSVPSGEVSQGLMPSRRLSSRLMLMYFSQSGQCWPTDVDWQIFANAIPISALQFDSIGIDRPRLIRNARASRPLDPRPVGWHQVAPYREGGRPTGLAVATVWRQVVSTAPVETSKVHERFNKPSKARELAKERGITLSLSDELAGRISNRSYVLVRVRRRLGIKTEAKKS